MHDYFRCGALLSVLLFFSSWTWCFELKDAVAQAIQFHPELKVEQRETEARDQEVKQARSGYLPRIDLEAGFGFQEKDPVSQSFSKPGRTRNELERHEFQINLQQMLFDGFDTQNDVANQKARLESSRYRTTFVGENVAFDVVRVYLEILKQKQILLLSQSSYNEHGKIYRRMRKRFESGVGSRADLDQITGRLALSKSNVLNQTANLLDAKASFQRLVGSYPNEDDLVFPQTAGVQLPATMDVLLKRAVDEHPLLKSAQADVAAVNHRYEQTKSAFYPRFSLEAGRTLNKNIDGVEGQVDDLRVMMRMRYNIFNGNADVARKQQLAYLMEKSKEIYRNAYLEVEQEARLAWIAYQNQRDQLPTLTTYAKSAELTKASYVKQFDLGKRTLLDLLNTENERVSAKRALISAEHDLVYSKYRLFHGIGNLLPTVGVPLP